MGVLINQIKLTIGGSEATAGIAVAREYVIPVRAAAGLNKMVNTAVDPAIVGKNMDAGSFLVSDDVNGNIPLSPRACGGMGQLLKSLLGKEMSVQQIGACARIRYTGASASAKITADYTENILRSLIGAEGSETGDAAFGATGTIDCDLAAYNTLGKVATAIEGYSDYECDIIFGARTFNTATGKILAFPSTAKQAKNMWCYLWFYSASSGIYKHEFYLDATSTTEHPTYSIQKDGYYDNFLYKGCVVNTLSMNAALKGMVEGEANALGFTETGAQTASALSLEDVDPLIFYNGSFSLGANEYTYIRNVSVNVNTNHNAEGYGQGSTSRCYHQKGKYDLTGDATVRLDATAFAERAKVFSSTEIAISYYFKGKNIGTSVIPEMMLVEIPHNVMTNFEFSENAGVFDAKIAHKGIYPKGTVYNYPITISIITQDSAAY